MRKESQRTEQRIVFLATTLSADLGGIARSVPALAAAVASHTESQRDAYTEVVLLGPKAERATVDERSIPPGLDLRLCNGVKGVKRELNELTRDPTQVRFVSHAGVWDPLNHYTARLCRRRGISTVVSIRSMLDPWALQYRRWKKRLAWWAYARRDLLGATVIHTTAELEAGHVRAALGSSFAKASEDRSPVMPPVIVVPNGVGLGGKGGLTRRHGDHGENASIGNLRALRDSVREQPRRLLFLSRIHPKKGVPDLIRAFGDIHPEGWELVIAGNDDPSAGSGQVGGYRKVCERLAAAQPNADRIRFLGPVGDEDKWPLYCSADLFVLPSYSENFGIVVGEALGMGVPVITTTATPWGEYLHTETRRDGGTEEKTARGTEGAHAEARRRGEESGLWMVAPGAKPLKEALKKAMGLNDVERAAKGRRGAEWIRREFAWDAIGRRFLEEVERELATKRRREA